MPKKSKNIVSNIKGYDVTGKSVPELIAFAKRVAKLANNRLYKLGYAGVKNTATTGGVKHIELSKITNKQTAIRAINKAKTVVNNPLSLVGEVKRLYKAAEKEYGKGGRMKFIAEEVKVFDSSGEWTGKYRLVPKAVPYGTNQDAYSWVDVQQSIRNFWDWYDTVGKDFISSDEAYDLWLESEYNDVDAIRAGEKKIYQRSEEQAQEYADTMETLFGDVSRNSWLK